MEHAVCRFEELFNFARGRSRLEFWQVMELHFYSVCGFRACRLVLLCCLVSFRRVSYASFFLSSCALCFHMYMQFCLFVSCVSPNSAFAILFHGIFFYT